jgi:hypothetical protein
VTRSKSGYEHIVDEASPPVIGKCLENSGVAPARSFRRLRGHLDLASRWDEERNRREVGLTVEPSGPSLLLWIWTVVGQICDQAPRIAPDSVPNEWFGGAMPIVVPIPRASLMRRSSHLRKDTYRVRGWATIDEAIAPLKSVRA